MATAIEPTLARNSQRTDVQHILSFASEPLALEFSTPEVSERFESVNAHVISEVSVRQKRRPGSRAIANSIIHDLKNPICMVRVLYGFDSRRKQRTSTVRTSTSMADKAVNGMFSMTQELLDYARG